MNNNDDEVVIPFRKSNVPTASNSSAQGQPSFNDLLLTVELLNQQLFIVQNAVTALLSSSTEKQKRLALNVVDQASTHYQSAFDVWPADLSRPSISEVVRIYSALFRVQI